MGEKTLRAEVIGQKGHCAAGHKKGDVLRIGCLRSCNLRGTFYDGIFPALRTFEYGGRLPWWRGDELLVTYPDPGNPVTPRITRDEA